MPSFDLIKYNIKHHKLTCITYDHILLSYILPRFIATSTTKFTHLSLHDALPIYPRHTDDRGSEDRGHAGHGVRGDVPVELTEQVVSADEPRRRRGNRGVARSEEHTSELQSPCNLVCRLLI